MNPFYDEQDDVLVVEKEATTKKLVIFNDEVNTFDFVIETLKKVCNHSPEQAEQCTMIIHYNGKCSVKEGSPNKLKPLWEAVLDRGISAEIQD